MAKKNVLGRGLGALIMQSETPISGNQANTTDLIDIRKIEVNPDNPRTDFDPEALEELAASIKQLGIIQPITVREIDNGRYQIISGERRYRASTIAGLTEIPAYIRHADDSDMLELALVENIQREDLDAVEVAISFQRLMDECQLTQESLSERVGKKRSTIANYLRLLKLPAEIQLAIRQGKISMGHARPLVNIEQPENQLKLLNDIIENEMSVRQVETAVRQINNPEPPVSDVRHATSDPDISNPKSTSYFVQSTSKISNPRSPNNTSEGKDIVIYEDPQPSVPENEQLLKERLSRYFGAKVDLKREASGAGRVVISFRTDAELQYILQMTEKMQELEEK